MFRSLLFLRYRRALCPCFVSSLFLLNLERHEKSSKLRQRLEQKKEKTRGIIIIKTDRLSLAFLSNRDGNSFLFSTGMTRREEGRKEKTSFFGEQRVIFHRKKRNKWLDKRCSLPLFFSLRVLKTCRAGKKKENSGWTLGHRCIPLGAAGGHLIRISSSSPSCASLSRRD